VHRRHMTVGDRGHGAVSVRGRGGVLGGEGERDGSREVGVTG